MSTGTVASAGLADPSEPEGGPAGGVAVPSGGPLGAVALPPRAERAERAQEAVGRLGPAGVDAVAVTWVDNAGITRVKAVPLSGLVHAAQWGVGAAPCFDVFLADDTVVTSRLIGGPTGDLRLYPDLDRLVPLAAQPGWAWAPGERYTQAGSPHPGCQRLFARRMTAAAAARGLSLKAGIEVEWVVALAGEPQEEPRFPTAGPAYGMHRLTDLSDYLREVLRALAEQGLTVLQIHPEYAPGQFEVSVAPEGPVEAADTTVLVRQTIRAVSARHGLRASFAPVVEAGSVGNGGHLHLSLWRDGHNLARGGSGPHGLTAEAEGFLAGVLGALPELLVLGSSSPAGYLRLVPSHWAGAYQCWGLENREAALRLVTGSSGERSTAANAEIKCFDATANPYLAVGAVLATGLAGLDQRLALPREFTGDPAAAAPGTVPRLPAGPAEAIAAYRKSAVLREAMGEPLYEAVLAVRTAESEQCAPATPQELVAATRWRY
ncbi:glutamine synthetase family protein [Streptomyces sp. CB01881]|uniref:glutamine synthetase family protein n=1 Tax=Streptomyces sp. CB01881 TaxID=2078691 RepID=UPI000CDBB741|nr:glutamine synthetase family protein [Streptomyces sp. CB01881]AUY49336.1 glutamine synthetase [Streptomyces sp. CB01881]TYC72724.1 glutamine synthetase [Streptomyces sp. CB01881]